MGFYGNPAEMYTARADRFKRDGDRHWAQAKNGQGDYHYGKAKVCYDQSKINRERAAQAKADNAFFHKKC